MAKQCSPCELSAALGISFGVCSRELKGKLDCRRLENNYVKGRIHKETVFREIYKAAKESGNTKVQKTITKVSRRIGVKLN